MLEALLKARRTSCVQRASNTTDFFRASKTSAGWLNVNSKENHYTVTRDLLKTKALHQLITLSDQLITGSIDCFAS